LSSLDDAILRRKLTRLFFMLAVPFIGVAAIVFVVVLDLDEDSGESIIEVATGAMFALYTAVLFFVRKRTIETYEPTFENWTKEAHLRPVDEDLEMVDAWTRDDH